MTEKARFAHLYAEYALNHNEKNKHIIIIINFFLIMPCSVLYFNETGVYFSVMAEKLHCVSEVVRCKGLTACYI